MAFASGYFSVAVVRWLMDNSYLVGLVTKTDKPKGRKRRVRPTPAAEVLEGSGIPIFKADKLGKDSGIREFLEALRPDLAIVVDYGVYIPGFVWKKSVFPFVNIHPSLLPRWRGPAPITWAIYAGDRVAGVTYHMLSSEIDAGDVILQESLELAGNERMCDLFFKLQALAIDMLPRLLEMVQEGLTARPQTGQITYAPKIPEQMHRLNFTWPADLLERLVRALAGPSGKPGVCNEPGAWTTVEVDKPGVRDGRIRLKILRAGVLDGDAQPGRVVIIGKSKFGIGTGRGILVPLEVQPHGGKVMPASAFMNGYRPKDGGLCL